MNSNDVAQAITDALRDGGSSWLIASIVAFLPVLWTMALMMHLGRPYVLRTLRRIGLRLGADVWWMSYLLMRDAMLLITFALSWIFFLPNLVVNLHFPLTGSLAALFLLLTLAVKLTRRVDDDVNAFRLSTVFLVIGASLYYAPLVFAVEAGGDAREGYPAWIANIFVTANNTTVALWFTWISLAGVVLVAGYLFMRLMNSANRSMGKAIERESKREREAQAVAGR